MAEIFLPGQIHLRGYGQDINAALCRLILAVAEREAKQ
jgi:hypothetical protein